MKNRLALVGALLGLVSTTVFAQQVAPQYFANPITLNSPGNVLAFSPRSLNNTGRVAVNTITTGSTARFGAAVIDANGGNLVQLPSMNQTNPAIPAYISSVNDDGMATGWGNNASGYSRGTYWDLNGQVWELVPLGNPAQPYSSYAYGVSTTGLIVGSADTGDQYGSMRAVLWNGSAGSAAPVSLQACFDTTNSSPFAGTFEQGFAISPNGQYVAGTCTNGANGETTAAIWTVSGTASTVQKVGNMGQAFGVNDTGVMVGYYYDAPPASTNNYNLCTDTGCQYAAVFYTTSYLTPTKLPLLIPGMASGQANSINDSGYMVGYSPAGDGSVAHAVMWSPDASTVFDLNKVAVGLPAGIVLHEAHKITSDGVILADGNDSHGNYVAYQLKQAIGSTVTVSSSVPTVFYGQILSLQAQVAPGDGTIPQAGAVSFYGSGKLLGSVAVKNGIAIFNDRNLNAGVYQMTATYSGSNPYGTATSAQSFYTRVAPSLTNVAVATSTTPTHGVAMTLTATVSAPYSKPTNGAVAFHVGSKTYTVAVNGSGKASFTMVPSAKGPLSISATYSPSNGNYVGSSAAITVNVK